MGRIPPDNVVRHVHAHVGLGTSGNGGDGRQQRGGAGTATSMASATTPPSTFRVVLAVAYTQGQGRPHDDRQAVVPNRNLEAPNSSATTSPLACWTVDFNLYDKAIGAAGLRQRRLADLVDANSLQACGAHHLMGNITGSKTVRVSSLADGTLDVHEDMKFQGGRETSSMATTSVTSACDC